MISFELTDEQDMLRQTIRDFAKNEIAPQAMERSAKEEFSIDLVHKMGELGLFGMTVSPDDGGQGLDTLSYVIAVEEIARVDGSAAATVAAGNSLGLGPIAQFGSKEQKQKYLPDLVTGKRLWSFGLTEPEAGSDAGSSKTTAVLERGQWVINGSKIFITNGSSEISAGCTVQAITGKKGEEKEISCILVEQETPGFTAKTMHNKLVWRASNTAELYFDDVKVPEKNLLGGRGQGFRQMLKTLDGGRLGIAAMALGGAEGAFEAALKYADERKTFGKPIKKHQAIAFKLADMATQIEAGRHLLYKGCWLKDQGKPFGKEAAMAKLFCSEMMGMVVDQAVQIHGGYGLMEEYPVARFYRDHKLLEIGEGSSEVQRIVISRHLGC